MKKIISLILITCTLHTNIVLAQETDLLGADAALKLIYGEQESIEKNQNDSKPTIFSQIMSLRENAENGFSSKQAEQWLSLSHQILSADTTSKKELAYELDKLIAAPVGISSMLASLPNKDSWSQLNALSRKSDNSDINSLVLRLYTSTLVDDKATRDDALKLIKTQVTKLDNNEQEVWNNGIRNIEYQIALKENDVDGIFDNLELQLTTTLPGYSYVEIPDIITLAGKQKAESWVEKMLPTSKRSFSVPTGGETKKMIQSIVLRKIDDLIAPQWTLVNDLDSIELYEAIDKKFPDNIFSKVFAKVDFSSEKANARSYYLISKLVSADSTELDELAALFQNEDVYLSNKTIKALKNAGHANSVQAFLYKAVSKNSESSYWDDYIALSSFVGESNQAKILLESVLEDKTLSSDQKSNMYRYYVKSLYANDQVEEAAQLVIDVFDQFSSEGRLELALQLAQIGLLKNNSKWVDFGLDQAKTQLEKDIANEEFYLPIHNIQKYVRILRSANKNKTAESFLLTQLNALINNVSKVSELYGPAYASYGLAEGNPLMAELIGIYNDGQRWNDILKLMDNYKYWGVDDLNTIYTLKDSTKTYFGYYIANALHHTDQTESATAILEALIWKDSGYDNAYQLYTSIESPTKASAYLETIYSKDQFEERPLIWQAQIKLNSNKLEEAKTLIKSAISIDPSDGEQGDNDRMRAYAILSEIHSKQGASDDAKLYAKVVKSIRISEQADKFTDLGILSTGISMYKQASEQFADAYCVQSRLAIQLTKSGNFTGAEQHYRKAYELMPDSFGRVESHCFGCESIFSDSRAQGIAETVFSEMVIKNPNKPQVHYMHGYLKEEQGQYLAALASYRKAVALDPEYLNAWKKIFQLSKKTHIEPWEVNNVALKLISLDPSFKHIRFDIEVVSDLKGLWQTFYEAKDTIKGKPSFSYQLSSSAEYKQSIKSENDSLNNVYGYSRFSNRNSTQYIETPSLSLLKTNIIQSIVNVNGAARNNF